MNKQTFLNVYTNPYLKKYIYNFIADFHKFILKGKRYRWKIVITRPALLAKYNYLDHLKQYFKNNYKKDFFSMFITRQKDTEFCDSHLRPTMAAAVKNERIEILTYLCHSFRSELGDLTPYVDTALKHGNLKSFDFLMKQIPESKRELYSIFDQVTIQCQDPKSIEWLIEGIDQDDSARDNIYNIVINAAKTKDLQLFIRTFQLFQQTNSSNNNNNNNNNESKSTFQLELIFSAVVSSGNIEMIKYLIKHSPKITAGRLPLNILEKAIYSGNIEMIKFLFNERMIRSVSKWTMTRAVQEGNLDMVQWLHFNRTEGFTKDAIDYACEHSLELVQWLKENCSECTTVSDAAITNTAKFNRLDILKYLIENNIATTFRVDAISSATLLGHIDIVKYLLEHDFYNRFVNADILKKLIMLDDIDNELTSVQLFQLLLENYHSKLGIENLYKADFDKLLDLANQKNRTEHVEILKTIMDKSNSCLELN